MKNQINKNIDNVWDFVDIPRLEYNEKDYFNHHLNKYSLVKEIINKTTPTNILDIGVATGIFYSLLQDFKGSVFGIDVVPEFIDISKRRGIEAQLCNIEKELIPHPDGSIDLVVCDSVLEHTLKPKHLMLEMRRVLKVGGNFIVVVPNATSILRRWHHLWGYNIFEPLIDNLYSRDYLFRCSVFYSERDLQFILKDNGLIVDEVIYINEASYDSNRLVRKIARFFSFLIPKLRDVIFLVGHKNP